MATTSSPTISSSTTSSSTTSSPTTSSPTTKVSTTSSPTTSSSTTSSSTTKVSTTSSPTTKVSIISSPIIPQIPIIQEVPLISENYTFITSLKLPASKGDTKIYVEDDSKFKIGDSIQIGTSDITIAKVIGFGSLILDTPLKFDYSGNIPVAIMKENNTIKSNDYIIYIVISIIVFIIILFIIHSFMIKNGYIHYNYH
jgi:hypothetical protein